LTEDRGWIALGLEGKEEILKLELLGVPLRECGLTWSLATLWRGKNETVIP